MNNLDFRAWNPRTKRMSYDVTLYANGWTECVYGSGMSIKHDPTELIVMQWSGLKDKKGNKIFDGDIVRVVDEPNSPYEKVYITEVIYNNGCFWLKEVDKQEVQIFYITYSPYNNSYIPLRCEVIGNIYENEELLK